MKIFLIGILFLAACSNSNQSLTFKNDNTASTNVVYGEDGRKDLSEITDPQLIQMAQSTVAFMDSKDLVYDSV